MREQLAIVFTEMVPDPLALKSSDVAPDSFRVSWKQPATDVVLYRLTWTPTDGGDSEEVLVIPPSSRSNPVPTRRNSGLSHIVRIKAPDAGSSSYKAICSRFTLCPALSPDVCKASLTLSCGISDSHRSTCLLLSVNPSGADDLCVCLSISYRLWWMETSTPI